MQTSSTMRRFLVACTGLIIIATSQTALSAQQPEDYKASYRYNAMGQVTGIIQADPDGVAGPRKFIATRNTYDGRGLLVLTEKGSLPVYYDETKDPQQWSGFEVYRQQIYRYDQLGRRTTSSVADAQGNEVSLTQTSYDSEHNVRCSAVRMNPAAYSSLPSDACWLGTEGDHGPDRITRFSYDASGWGAVTLEERAVGTPLEQDYKSYEYDSERLLTGTTDANGNYTHYGYDSLGRLYRMYFPSKTTAGFHSTTDYEQYTYDENNNLTVLRKRDGRVIVYTYDKLNRVTRKYFPIGGGTLVYYGYDLRGLQTYARFWTATGEGITNTYDGFGSVATSTNNMDGISRTLSYRYDADSNRIRVTHPDNKFFTYEFDGLSRLTQVREQGSYSLSDTVYSDDGRPDLVNRSGGNVVTDFEFDDVLRPNEFGHDFYGTADDVAFSYTYQPSNQIATRTITNDNYIYDEHSIGSEAYQVNGLNQYTSVDGKTYTYDDNGNLTSDGSTTYSYDIENRLISTTGGSVATLKYDPNGRLYEVSGGGNTTRFLYDGDQLVAEYSTGGTMRKRYVHGSGIDDPIVEYDGATVASSTRKHLFKDHLGSVVATTNNVGAVVDSNSFDSYGIPAAGNVGRFGFTGQMYIAEVGLNYYKARMYSPRLGRFLQTDPIGYDDGMNIYAYVGNDPVSSRDPTGLSRLTCPPEETSCPTDEDEGEEIEEIIVTEKLRSPKKGMTNEEYFRLTYLALIQESAAKADCNLIESQECRDALGREDDRSDDVLANAVTSCLQQSTRNTINCSLILTWHGIISKFRAKSDFDECMKNVGKVCDFLPPPDTIEAERLREERIRRDQ